MLGVVLFAQGVVAANACDVLRGNVAQAFTAKAEEMAEMHCHQAATSNANACFVHCTQGDQVSVDQVVPIFVAPSIVTLVIEVPVMLAITSSYFASQVVFDSGPPASIRFCSLQV